MRGLSLHLLARTYPGHGALNEQSAAWHALVDGLCTPGLVLRHADPKLPFILHTDWSHHGISAVLGQLDSEGHEYMVACTSRTCIPAESRYGSYRGEMLAAVWGIKSFRHYLLGAQHPFTLYTDHRALVWLMSTPHLEGQYARWALQLQDYEFSVKYKPGVTHTVADVPSRQPLATTSDYTGAREPASSSDDRVSRWASLLPEGPVSPSEGPVAMTGLASCLSHLGFSEVALGSNADLASWAEPGIFCASSAAGPCSLLSHVAADPDLGQMSCRDSSDDEEVDLLFTATRQAAFATVSSSPHSRYDPSCYDPHSCDFPVEEAQATSAILAAALAQRAARLVDSVRVTLDATPPSVPLHRVVQRCPDGVTRVLAVNTAPVPDLCISHLLCTGVVVLELFGGMCAGLEMLLRNGVRIQRYRVFVLRHQPILTFNCYASFS